MTAADTAPSITLDRYLALLAILLALALGLLIIGEREKQPRPAAAIVGSLPPPPDPREAALLAERDGLRAESTRLAEALAAAETALGQAEAEIEAHARENERLRQLLGNEAAALETLAGRLAVAESERDRLGGEVRDLNRSRAALEARIAELKAAPAASSPPQAPSSSASASTSLPTPSSPESAGGESGSGLGAALAELRRHQGAPAQALAEAGPASSDGGGAEGGGDSDDPAAPLAAPPLSAGEVPGPESSGPPRRLTTFGPDGPGGTSGVGGTTGGRTVAAGIEAYNAGDYALAEQVWGRLAAAGDRRGQFYFGSLLFEGRTAPPDPVMAHVWLSRSVDAGYLPAIEVRRRVRAAMTEEQYEEALAIQAGG